MSYKKNSGIKLQVVKDFDFNALGMIKKTNYVIDTNGDLWRLSAKTQTHLEYTKIIEDYSQKKVWN